MRLLSILDKFPRHRVLVIGDLILDSYIWGKVSRISPEAPVPVVDVVRKTYVLGGAANVANNIASMGGHATVLGIIGEDRAGERMKGLLEDLGVRHITIADKRPTTVKTRVVAHSQQMVRFDQESREKLSGKSLKHLVDTVRQAIEEHDAVVISDYKKGVITPEVISAAASAVKKGKFVALDPKVGHFHLYKGLSIMTPNLNEAAQGAGVEISDESSLIDAGRKLLAKTKSLSVLITRGEDGMSLFEDGNVSHIPTMARHVYDVTGAGDTVVAAIALAKAAGATTEQAALISNHAAGIVVGEVGTAVTTAARIAESIKSAETKIKRKKF